jgi:hypothetical protein
VHLSSCSSGSGRKFFVFSSRFNFFCAWMLSSRCFTYLLGLQSIQWVRKLIVVLVIWPEYPGLLKKKEKEGCSLSKVYLNKKSNHIFSEKNKILNHHVSTGYMHRRNLVNYYQMADYKNLLINNCLPVHHSIHFINLLINYVK